MPYMPRLETDGGAALVLLRLQLAGARARRESFISLEIADSAFVSALRMIGVISPPGIATATADVGVAVLEHGALGPR